MKNKEVKTENKKEKKISKKEEFLKALQFLFFSCTAGVIQIGTFTLMNEVFVWSYWPSYLISLTLSVLWNFTINRRFTFKAANNMWIAMSLVIAYYLVFTPLSTLWGDALTDTAGWNEYLVLAMTMVINFITEYLFTRFVVYGKSVNSREPSVSVSRVKEKGRQKEIEALSKILGKEISLEDKPLYIVREDLKKVGCFTATSENERFTIISIELAQGAESQKLYEKLIATLMKKADAKEISFQNPTEPAKLAIEKLGGKENVIDKEIFEVRIKGIKESEKAAAKAEKERLKLEKQKKKEENKQKRQLKKKTI